MPLTSSPSDLIQRLTSRPKLAFSQQLAVELGLSCVLFGLITAALGLSIQRIDAAREAERQSSEVILLSESILSGLTDVETGQRGYVISGGQEEYLQPYLVGRATVPAELEELRQKIDEDEVLSPLILRMALAIDARIATADQVVETLRSEDSAEAEAIVRSGRGKDYHDQVRALVARIEAAEQTRRVERERSTESYLQSAYIVCGILGIAALLSQVRSYQTSIREVRLRLEAEDELEALAHQKDVLLTQLRYTVSEEIVPLIESTEQREQILTEMRAALERTEHEGGVSGR